MFKVLMLAKVHSGARGLPLQSARAPANGQPSGGGRYSWRGSLLAARHVPKLRADREWAVAAVAAASIALLPLAVKAVAGTNWNVLYATTNLAGHALSYESNPGTTGGPPCSLSDVSLSVFADYGTVTANANRTNIFVNAIGYRKFIETYTNGQAVSLGIYRYRGSLRLPAVPAPSVVQTQNAQTVQMMIQVWDGREKLWDSNSNALEATMYWDLNPWNADFGKVKIYTMNTGALALVNTGITVPPDTNWHTFELVADFSNRTFISAGMDGIVVNLSAVSIAQVTHTDWSTNVAISMTAESMNTWPGASFDYVFWWTTEFRGLDFARQEYVADTEAPVPNPMTWSVPPVPMNGTSVTMTASAASDDAGVVYYFEEITGGAGAAGRVACRHGAGRVRHTHGATPGYTIAVAGNSLLTGGMDDVCNVHPAWG